MERNDMAEHNNGKTVRTNSQVMDLSQLIAGPLVAAIEADAMASRSYFDFLTQVAFEGFNQNSGKAGALRMISFEYDDRDGNGICRKRVSIPLLTLISFPLLQLKEADFDFDIRVADAVSEENGKKFSYTNGTLSEKPAGKPQIKMRASLAKQSGADGGSTPLSLSANMKVRIRMRQSDMPAGLSNLLHIAENSLGVSDVVETQEEK